MPETESLPCPGCHTLLPLEATGCPICLRGRTRQEIMRGYAALREEKARRRRRPFQILAAVLVLGAAGKMAADHRVKLEAAVRSAGSSAYKWADAQRDPSHYAGAPEGGPPPVAPDGAMRSALNPPSSPPPELTGGAPGAVPRSGSGAAPAAKGGRPARPKPLAKNAWRVSGTVYDLESLRPVPNADITFTREGSAPVPARTGDDGTYEADLVKADGWTVSVNSAQHRRGQMLDIDPPYRDRDADERRAALEHITDGDLIPAPVGWKRSESKPRLDLVVTGSAWQYFDRDPRR